MCRHVVVQRTEQLGYFSFRYGNNKKLAHSVFVDRSGACCCPIVRPGSKIQRREGTCCDCREVLLGQ